MAAIDIRHLAAPFTNKLNLIVIIFVVILFAIFRLSVNEKVAVNERARERIVEPVNREIPAPQPKPSSGDLLDELLGQTKKTAPVFSSDKNVADEAPFKDIEAALGIGH